MKMFRNWSKKRTAKFVVTTLSYSVVKNAHLSDTFSEIFKLEASPVDTQSLLKKEKERKA